MVIIIMSKYAFIYLFGTAGVSSACANLV